MSSRRSPEWANITEKERERLGLTFDDDGEFWFVVILSHFPYVIN